MRSWILVLTACAFAGFATMGGCSGDNVAPLNPGSTVGVGTGSTGSHALGCNGSGPDGFCNARGQNPESCACPDCAETAFCRGTCSDDGACGYTPDSDPPSDEDCTCADCFAAHSACPPYKSGCNDTDEGACSPEEDCTCAACAGAERCGCDGNGQCVEALEGCSCADCANAEACGGEGPTTTTTTTTTSASGGMGGAGGAGMGGAGGA